MKLENIFPKEKKILIKDAIKTSHIRILKDLLILKLKENVNEMMILTLKVINQIKY